MNAVSAEIALIASELDAVMCIRRDNVVVARFWLNGVVRRLETCAARARAIELALDEVVEIAREEADAMSHSDRVTPIRPSLSIIPGGVDPEPPSAA